MMLDIQFDKKGSSINDVSFLGEGLNLRLVLSLQKIQKTTKNGGGGHQSRYFEWRHLWKTLFRAHS